MSDLFVDNIKHQSSQGSGTITIGASGETISIPSGATLTVPNGGLTGQNYPAFMAHNNGSTTQSCATVATTEVTNFTTEMFDTNSAFNTSTGRFTPQVAGKYFFTASLYMTNNPVTVNFSFIIIGKNNSVNLNSINEVGFIDRNPLSTISVNGIIEMNGTTDFVSVFFHQQSTVSQNIGGAGGASLHFFGGYRIGA
jgi:hypothetical protein